MTIQRQGTVPWLSVFPFKEQLGDFHGGKAFVDIGGGFGHQCIAVRDAFPELSGSLELQDLPQTLQLISTIEGIDVVSHNFFEPQITKGARAVLVRMRRSLTFLK